MPRAVVESVIALGAAKCVLKTHKEQIAKWARKTGGYKAYCQAIGLLDVAAENIVEHACVEQVCAIQHNTSNVWVNVDASAENDKDKINIGTSRGHEYLRVDQRDLQRLMCAARGGLTDENGQSANCHNCPHCFERKVWQTCELYHLINSIPCDTLEIPQICDDVCPYALAREDGGMEL